MIKVQVSEGHALLCRVRRRSGGRNSWNNVTIIVTVDNNATIVVKVDNNVTIIVMVENIATRTCCLLRVASIVIKKELC